MYYYQPIWAPPSRREAGIFALFNFPPGWQAAASQACLEVTVRQQMRGYAHDVEEFYMLREHIGLRYSTSYGLDRVTLTPRVRVDLTILPNDIVRPNKLTLPAGPMFISRYAHYEVEVSAAISIMLMYLPLVGKAMKNRKI